MCSVHSEFAESARLQVDHSKRVRLLQKDATSTIDLNVQNAHIWSAKAHMATCDDHCSAACAQPRGNSSPDCKYGACAHKQNIFDSRNSKNKPIHIPHKRSFRMTNPLQATKVSHSFVTSGPLKPKNRDGQRSMVCVPAKRNCKLAVRAERIILL